MIEFSSMGAEEWLRILGIFVAAILAGRVQNIWVRLVILLLSVGALVYLGDQLMTPAAAVSFGVIAISILILSIGLPASRFIDEVNWRVGRVVMYGAVALLAVLLWSTFTKSLSQAGLDIRPSIWTLDMAQFLLMGYFLLGGPLSVQTGDQVRMDLFYGALGPKRKALMDAVTAVFLLTYLLLLLYGGISSSEYSLQYGERAPTLWRPYLWPVKLTMCAGIFLMLAQALSELIKDLDTLRGGTARAEFEARIAAKTKQDA